MVEFNLLINWLNNMIVLLTSATGSSEASISKVFTIGNNEFVSDDI